MKRVNTALTALSFAFAFASACAPLATPRSQAQILSEVTASEVDSGLKSALKSADIKEFTDYNRNFYLTSFPAGTTVEEIVAKIMDIDAADVDLGSFKPTSGEKAVKVYAQDLRQIAEGEDLSEEDGPVRVKVYNQIADAVEKAFLPVTKFSNVQYLLHTIAEDGDMEYRLLVAQKPDGSWMVLTYSDFPF